MAIITNIAKVKKKSSMFKKFEIEYVLRDRPASAQWRYST